jgi:hypothetical protein
MLATMADELGLAIALDVHASDLSPSVTGDL